MAAKKSLEYQLEKWSDRIRVQPFDPKPYIQRGMVNFKLARIEASIQDFDKAEQIDSRFTPFLWQRGLSYYYAEKFEAGAKQFEIDLSVNAQDVEETIWRYLCIAQFNGLTQAKQDLPPVRNDPRLIMQRVYELYAGVRSPEDVLATAMQQEKRGLFYGYLYLGLYYEAASQVEQAKEYIVKAVAEGPFNDYMWYLAAVHQKLRGWAEKHCNITSA